MDAANIANGGSEKPMAVQLSMAYLQYKKGIRAPKHATQCPELPSGFLRTGPFGGKPKRESTCLGCLLRLGVDPRRVTGARVWIPLFRNELAVPVALRLAEKSPGTCYLTPRWSSQKV